LIRATRSWRAISPFRASASSSQVCVGGLRQPTALFGVS
jgi:hypothetical protein